MQDSNFQDGAAGSVQNALELDTASGQPRAWAMIEEGRYQPRRIKGSCLGRELG